MWMRELDDKPVVSVAEGTKVGTVHDLLLDAACSNVVAFQVGGGGLLGGHKQAIPYSAVRGIGPDAVMVEGRDALQDVTDVGPFGDSLRRGDLQQEVMTEGGLRLGRVKDGEFDPATGAVTGVLFEPKGDWTADSSDEYVVARDDIVSLTPKMVIVRHELVAPHDAATEQSRPRDLGHLVSRVTEQERNDGANGSGHDADAAAIAEPAPADAERVASDPP